MFFFFVVFFFFIFFFFFKKKKNACQIVNILENKKLSFKLTIFMQTGIYQNWLHLNYFPLKDTALKF